MAKDGPVVVLLDDGRALILQQDRHASIDLPVNYSDLVDLHRSLQVMANSRDSLDWPDLIGESVSTDTYPVTDSLNPARNSRSLRKARRDAFPHLLEALWRHVVEPVLVELLGCGKDDNGKSGKWEAPVSSPHFHPDFHSIQAPSETRRPPTDMVVLSGDILLFPNPRSWSLQRELPNLPLRLLCFFLHSNTHCAS